jgi:hypothetical protein
MNSVKGVSTGEKAGGEKKILENKFIDKIPFVFRPTGRLESFPKVPITSF